MSEIFRTKTHQFCDVELYMVIDTVTGEKQRAFNGNCVGTLNQAVDYIKRMSPVFGGVGRTIIVKCQCIAGHKLHGED